MLQVNVTSGDTGSAAAASTDAEVPAEASTGWQQRYTIVGLCFVAFMLCNMDRVNMSIAILPMQQEFAWSPQTVGIVQSSFFWCALASCAACCLP